MATVTNVLRLAECSPGCSSEERNPKERDPGYV